MQSKGNFIANHWKKAGGAEFNSIQPVTDEILWQGHEALADEVDAAVTAAQKSFATWSTLPFSKRHEYLKEFVELLQKDQENFAHTLAHETGKPLWESKTEVTTMISKLDISVQAYQERTGERRQELPQGTLHVRHRPYGPLAVLGPFNFPGHLPNGHIIPALLAGNTIIFKPSELTPLVSEKYVELWQEANLPSGVLNLVQGGGKVGQALTSHAGLAGVLFTGSFPTGQKIHAQFAGRPEIILALEMGGNNPLLVFETEDLEAAVYNTIQSSFVTAGQRCTCARRIIVPDDRFGEQFVKRLLEVSKQLLVGHFDDEPQPFYGSVISKQAADHIMTRYEAMLAAGGEALLPLSSLAKAKTLITPGIVDTTHCKQRSDTEIFGPVAQIIRVKDFKAAIEEANNTAYGLSAGLLSDNAEYYQALLSQSRAGIINWNRPTTGAAAAAPFGGTGHSGNHRPSAYYAADYCAYPVASMEGEELKMPEKLSPGIKL